MEVMEVENSEVVEHDGMLPKENIDDKEKTFSREERGTWTNRLDFVMSFIGFAVGLGNIWRFPYLCYKNGGDITELIQEVASQTCPYHLRHRPLSVGAFLIPYFFFLAVCGIPLLVLEVGLGQYMGAGCIGAWRICPAFAGIGVASFIIMGLLNFYYIIILAWAIFYLYNSFSAVLPWSNCDNTWNTPRCFAENASDIEVFPENDSSLQAGNSSEHVDAVVEFWERQVLHISSGIDEPGYVVPGLVISLLIAWVLIYFIVWRGIKWSGKVAYFTASFPYIVLTVLLIRGVTLDGASDGLWFYIKPDISRLADSQVWIDGGTQVFFSYAIVYGGPISLGSYNKFHNNFFKDCMIIVAVNCFTSLYGGIAVFSVLGFMANQKNVSIAEVVDSGPGLVFITYPKAVTHMPLPQIWAILFFVMILLIGIDSQFVQVEGILTPIFDMFPRALSGMKKRMLVSALYCLLSFLVGISMVTQGGMYVFQLFDHYSAGGVVLLLIAFFEAFVIAWVFGSEKFHEALESMLGYRLPRWFDLCWKFITPLVSMGMFLFVLTTFRPPKYKTYTYPTLAKGFGTCLAIASVICIPIVFCVRIFVAEGTLKQRWKTITKPQLRENELERQQ